MVSETGSGMRISNRRIRMEELANEGHDHGTSVDRFVSKHIVPRLVTIPTGILSSHMLIGGSVTGLHCAEDVSSGESDH